MSQDDPMSASNGHQRPIDPELVSAFYDGETNPEERAAVEACMDETSNTLQTLDDYDQLTQSLKQLHGEARAPDLRAGVLAQIGAARPAAAASTAPVGRRRLFSIVAGVSGLAAAVVLLLWPQFDARHENTVAVNDTAAPREVLEPEIALASRGPSMSAPEAADAGAAAFAAVPMAAASTAEMEASVESSLARMVQERPRPEVGEVMGYLDRNADSLTWVSVTVADVREVGDRIQVLLARNGVASPESAEPAEQSADPENLMTFLVEADWDQMEAVIVDLSDAEFIDSLVVHAPQEDGVPVELQGYAVTRAADRDGRLLDTLKKRVQNRQAPETDADADGSEARTRDGVQLQLLVRDADLKRLAARRRAEPALEAPADAVSPAAPDPPAASSGLGRPLASPRARAVIVIQPQDQ